MKKKRFREEQIVRILQGAETWIPARDICRKHSISEQTYYRWKSRYGGMDVSEAKRLKELERENTELKKLVAKLTFNNRMLRAAKKCMVRPEFCNSRDWRGEASRVLHKFIRPVGGSVNPGHDGNPHVAGLTSWYGLEDPFF